MSLRYLTPHFCQCDVKKKKKKTNGTSALNARWKHGHYYTNNESLIDARLFGSLGQACGIHNFRSNIKHIFYNQSRCIKENINNSYIFMLFFSDEKIHDVSSKYILCVIKISHTRHRARALILDGDLWSVFCSLPLSSSSFFFVRKIHARASHDTKVRGVGSTWKGLKEFTPLIFRRELSAR